MIGYSVVNSKGQVTIPSGIRRSVGIGPKGRVVVTEIANSVMVTPVADILALRGSVRSKSRPEDFKKMREAFIQYMSSKRVKK